MRLIILGAGGTGRGLLSRLGDLWEVVVVDTDPTRLDRATEIRAFEAVEGDGSSAVVLGRAGLDDAAALVAATSDDDANIEAIRIAQQAGLLRIVGVAADPDRLDDYKALDVPAFAPHRFAARHVELALEPRRVASSAFAGGKAEAVEVELSPDTPVAGKRLRDLHSRTWVVAAILRGDRLIVPHGDTTLEVGDRVTVVGAAADYASIVAAFAAGINTFPLAFGRKVAVALGSQEDLRGPVTEAASLVRNSRADVLTVVHVAVEGAENEDADDVRDLLEGLDLVAEGVDVEFRPATSLQAGLVAVAADESIGVIVVPGPDPAARFGRFRVARLINAFGGARTVPLLLSRSRLPYTEVLVPARRTDAAERAARAAIDLARSTRVPLSGLAAVAPAFVATRTDTVEAANAAMAWLEEEAAVHGVTVDRRVRQGNPVRVMAGFVSTSSLLVVGAPDPPVRGLTLGIAGLVAARVPASVLLVPTEG